VVIRIRIGIEIYTMTMAVVPAMDMALATVMAAAPVMGMAVVLATVMAVAPDMGMAVVLVMAVAPLIVPREPDLEMQKSSS